MRTREVKRLAKEMIEQFKEREDCSLLELLPENSYFRFEDLETLIETLKELTRGKENLRKKVRIYI